MMERFKGLGVAMITPFKKNLEIDYTALEKVLDHLYNSNALDYLVAMGSTGEAATLTDQEKQDLLTFIADYNNDRIPLMAGFGGNYTDALIKSLKKFDLNGYSAFLSVSPAYVKPSQQGIVEHYYKVADNAPLPVMVYNVPSRTGSNITASTVAKLAKHENIFGIKDASADVVQAMEIKALTSDFLLVSGDDMILVPLCSVGADGLISVLGNAYPNLYKDTIEACNTRDYAKASDLAKSTLNINKLMYEEGNPAGVKQLMAHLGLCEPYVRLPLAKVSDNLSTRIKSAML
jgi:4-hydroxy-tetrahydrodipicolinate synthase